MLEFYNEYNTITRIERRLDMYPEMLSYFLDWLLKYSNLRNKKNIKDKYSVKIRRYENNIIYNIENENDYIRAIIDYISGMTDSFAIKVFNELTSF